MRFTWPGKPARVGVGFTFHKISGAPLMPISMYYGSVPVFLQLLPAMSGCLDKGQAFAEARKYDPNLLLQLRLSPDMFPLARQVQQATNHALAPGRIAGVELPKFTDTGASVAELKQRIATTVDFL